MANDFVNTITTSNGTTYDVQDKRLTVTAADAGKVISVDSNGNLSLTTPTGGTKLYRHQFGLFEVISLDSFNYMSGNDIINSFLAHKILAFYLKSNYNLGNMDIMYDSTNQAITLIQSRIFSSITVSSNTFYFSDLYTPWGTIDRTTSFDSDTVTEL